LRIFNINLYSIKNYTKKLKIVNLNSFGLVEPLDRHFDAM